MIIQSEITLVEPGQLVISRGSLPDPAPGEARVRIRRIGVCGTDIHAYHGRQPFFEYPRILGHELGAEVVAINGDSDLRPGEAVAVEPYLNDPDSPASRRGKTNCCESLKVLGVHCDGGMRPELNIPLHKLHRAASASMDQLALVETLCIGQHAVNRSLVSTFELAAHGGRIVFVGLFQGEVTFNDPNFHRRELSVLSSRNATSAEFGQVIAAMESGAIDTNPWITHRLDFAEVPSRFASLIADMSLRKAVIHLDG